MSDSGVRLWRVRNGTSGDDQREQGERDKDVKSHRAQRGRTWLQRALSATCSTRLNVSTSRRAMSVMVASRRTRWPHSPRRAFPSSSDVVLDPITAWPRHGICGSISALSDKIRVPSVICPPNVDYATRQVLTSSFTRPPELPARSYTLELGLPWWQYSTVCSALLVHGIHNSRTPV